MKSKFRLRKKKLCILVDVSHILYVCYFGIEERHRTAAAIMAKFLDRVLQLMEENSTTNLVFCWDSPTSIRKDRYSFYKEKRHSKPDPTIKYLHEAKNELQTVLPAIGFHAQLEVDGYEADDIVCEVVRRNPDTRFIIVASDNDLLQILKYRNLLGLFTCRDNKLTTYPDFVSAYGIKPEYWHLYKAIGGCKSDEVPGIKGIGDAYALRFLKGVLHEATDGRSIAALEKIHAERNGVFLRNHWLVTLPLPGLKEHELELLEVSLCKKSLEVTCLAYNIEVTHKWGRFAK